MVARPTRAEPDVTVFVDTGLFTTVSDQSLIGDVIREAHGTQRRRRGGGGGPGRSHRPAPARPGRLPRHLGHGSQPRRPAPEPAGAEAPRGQGGPFVTADADLLEPGPAIGEGLAEVAHLLHPDAFR